MKIAYLTVVASVGLAVVSVACSGPEGPPGPAGPVGSAANQGAQDSGATPANALDSGMPSDGGGTAVLPDGGAEVQAPTSGTRIIAVSKTTTVTTTTSDGAKSVVSYPVRSWFDSQRGEPCMFASAGDGQTRCLPSEYASDYSGGSYYLDSSCSQPVAFTIVSAPLTCGGTVSPGPSAPKYLWTPTNAANGCSGQVVRLIGTVVTPGSIYLKGLGTQCFSTPTSSSYTYYQPGAAIDPTEFVSSSTTTVTE